MANTTLPRPGRFAAPLLLAAVLTACAAPQGEYPSLRVRPAERLAADFETTAALPQVPETPEPADLLARAGQYAASAREADAGFRQLAPLAGSRAQAARGAEPGSNRWSDAQIAIAMLDSQRSKTAAALADLDLLYAERALALESRAGIDLVRQEVANMVSGQDLTLENLKAMIEQ